MQYAGVSSSSSACYMHHASGTIYPVIGGFAKTARVSHFMREVLHWLPFPQRFYFRISSLVWICLLGEAPLYLQELCCPVSSCDSRSFLRSAAYGDLIVPFARTATKQRRAFSVVGPVTWNGLPREVRCLPRVFSSPFYVSLRTVFFAWHWLGALLSRDLEGALYKFILID